MEIKHSSQFVKQKTEVEINYGVVSYGGDTKVDLDFYNTNYVTSGSSCGCTPPTVTHKEGYFTLTISYDSTKVGTFNQYVIVTTTDGEIRITLNGQVV